MRRRHRWGILGPRFLVCHTQVRVRFQEVDSLRVVWHGHYLSYCEEGRTAFGREHGFSYQSILAAGYIAPLVHFELDYFQPARFDQIVNIETRMHLDPGARINFSYRITDSESPQKIATGRSVQVFTEADGSLLLTRPEFFAKFLADHEDQVQEH
jgi:acyl-CoA thioester hydrolase